MTGAGVGGAGWRGRDRRADQGGGWVKGGALAPSRPRATELLSASPEIKEALSSLPSYWSWLRKIKLPECTREGTDAGCASRGA